MRLFSHPLPAFRPALQLALGLILAPLGWALPAIQSVEVQPTPLQAGSPFTVAVAATGVTQGTATVDFRPWSARVLRVTLSLQGARWTGTGVIPADLAPPPGAEAVVKALMFDAARLRAEATVRVPVSALSGITAVFDPPSGVLTVTGDGQDNTIAVDRDVVGNLRVNNGTVPISGGVPTVANTSLIRVLGRAGSDQIILDQANGALPRGDLQGESGNDTLTGANGADDLAGGPGTDVLIGRGGGDRLFGGDDGDTFVWNPGDGSDVLEGQGGIDTMLFNGSNANESIDLSANGGRVLFFRNIANVTMDLNDVEVVRFNALGGADTIVVGDLSGTDLADVALDLASPAGSGTGDGQPDSVAVDGSIGGDAIQISGSAAGILVTGLPATVTIAGAEGANDLLAVEAGGGNDTINASALPAGLVRLVINGGGGTDSITGSRGNDVLFGGDASDTFVWNPGDGSDVIEGQAGADTLIFNGSNAAETVGVVANGSRLSFSRNVGNILMDLAGVETVQFNAAGGADVVTVGDLAGTGVTAVGIDLAGTPGSGIGDGQTDSISVNGTNGDDVISVAASGAGVLVSGLAASVSLTGSEGLNDTLVINAQGGNDVVQATGLPAGRLALTVNGGLGADLLLGSAGNDLLVGGDGNDTVLAGAGDDTMVWNPGDDNDTLEGQGDLDTMLFNGSNVAEVINLSANGGRVLFFRNIANVTMDLNDVEVVQFNALGGADTITVNDLSGTDLLEVGLDLALPAGSGTGDAQADSIIVNGTGGDDLVLVADSPDGVAVSGLAAQVFITGSEVANDRVTINALGGDDVVEASGLAAGFISLTADGGADDDILIGSDGPDVLLGGPGDDVLIGGPGVDVLDGGPGNNVVIQ